MKAEELDKKFDDDEDVLDLFDLSTLKRPNIENTLLRNPHVGEILKYEFLEELDISANSLADSLLLSYSSIQQIIKGKAPMTADVDLRLCRYFGLSDGYFLRLHYAYELMEAKRNLGDILCQIVPIAALH
jgi:addiction module HigA family antidote